MRAAHAAWTAWDETPVEARAVALDRAADAFVKITLYLAAVWVLAIMIHVKLVKLDTAPADTTAQTDS